MIQKFTDLIAWQQGHQLVLSVYKVTHSFPKTETFALTDQLKRAAVSVTSNIAEGFGSKSNKEKIQFYYLSLGSLAEIENQLIIAKDLNYIDSTQFQRLTTHTNNTGKLLNGLIRSIRLATAY